MAPVHQLPVFRLAGRVACAWLRAVVSRLTQTNPGLDFLFHMFFLTRYCRLLEEGSFRGRTADFLYMLLFGPLPSIRSPLRFALSPTLTRTHAGAALLSCIAPWVHIQFLGSSLTFMMVYVWGRRNSAVNMSFLGLFNFSAPYLPWVLLAFSWVLGSSPLVDLLGIGAGHVYYLLSDVYPLMTGRRPLATPALVRALVGEEGGFRGGVAGGARRGEGAEQGRAG